MQAINRPLPTDYFRDVASLRAVCGDAFLRNVILVSTVDSNKRQRAKEKEERTLNELCADSQLWQPLIRHGAQQVEFDVASAESARNVLGRLPANSPSKPLRIQLEMAKARDVEATSAYWRVARAHHKWFCRLRHNFPAWRCVCGRAAAAR